MFGRMVSVGHKIGFTPHWRKGNCRGASKPGQYIIYTHAD
jgi:hypothetical protein